MTVILIVFLICFITLFAYRNNWVYEKITEYNDKIFRYRIFILYKNYEHYRKLPLYSDYLCAIESYNVMLLKFWIWDINKFVLGKKLYLEIQNGHRKTI